MDNSAEPQHKFYQRKFYRQIMSVVVLLNMKSGDKHFCARSEGDIIRIFRISDGETTIPEPPLSADPKTAAVLASARQGNKGGPRKSGEERRVEQVLAQEEERLNKPENQLKAFKDQVEDVNYSILGRSVLSLVEKLVKTQSTGRDWYLVTVGGVAMGPPAETLAHAKQMTKLYKHAKVVHLKEVV
jgi:hypothetical protein